MFHKISLSMLTLLMGAASCYAMESQKFQVYEIDSLTDLSPENYEKLTGLSLDAKTLLGFNVNGTLTKTEPTIREYGYDLIEFWNDDEKMAKAYGRTFASQEEAVDFYRQLVPQRLKELNLKTRVFLAQENTPEIIRYINQTGATTFCITQREGQFENFSHEASFYGLKFTMQDQGEVAHQFKEGMLYTLNVNNEEVNKSLRLGKHEERNKSGILVSYQDSVIYTGWRRIKGLALKTFLQDVQALPEVGGGKFSTLAFVDDKTTGFSEMYQQLSPHFSKIFFFHLKG